LFLDILASSSSVITDREEDLSTATKAGSSTVTEAGSFHSSFTCLPTPLQNDHVVNNFFGSYESLSRSTLSELAVAHGLTVNPNLLMEDL
jgi:hypothetical protein